MSETALATIDTATVQQEVAPVIQAADALVVRNVDEHKAGLELLGRVMWAETRIKTIFKPAIEAAMETKRKAEMARQEIIGLQDSVLAPVIEARKTISEKCAGFEREERRVAALNQAAIEKEALAKQEQEREMDAAMAGTEEEAEEVLTEPLAPPMVPIVRPEVAKVAGISTRETWAAEMHDAKAFYRWCIETDNMYMAGEPNMIALNGRARAEHDKLSIPGVRAVSTLSHARR